MCSGWHHRGSLPGVTLMPDSHPGRLGPTVGWTSLQPFHPSLGAHPFISADITSGCLGFGQMPGPLKRGPLDRLRKGCGWRKSREDWGRCRWGQDCARRSLGLRWEAREESEPQAVRTVGCSRVTSLLWAPVSPAVVPLALSCLGFCVSGQLLSLEAAAYVSVPPPPPLFSLPSAPLSSYCPPGSRLSPD